MADVVEQRCHPNRHAVIVQFRRQLAQLVQGRDCTASQMVCTESVLESGMGCSRIHQEAVPDLANVAQALNGGCVESEQGGPVKPDVVPERIADDFGVGGRRGGGAVVFGGVDRQVFTRSCSCLCRPAVPPPRCPAHTGPAAATEEGTSARYCSKFSRNMVASFLACAS